MPGLIRCGEPTREDSAKGQLYLPEKPLLENAPKSLISNTCFLRKAGFYPQVTWEAAFETGCYWTHAAAKWTEVTYLAQSSCILHHCILSMGMGKAGGYNKPCS